MTIAPGYKRYLGDGVYASVDDANQIWLETAREGGEVHKIALEGSTFGQLMTFARDAWGGDA